MNIKAAFLIITIFFSFNGKVFSQTVPLYVPTNGLQVWLPFNGNAIDESGNGNYGIPVSVVLAGDRFGSSNSAYSFNGSTSRIKIKNNFFNTGWNSWTVSCWVNSTALNNPNNNNNNQCIINTIPHNGISLSSNWGSSNKYAIWVGSNATSSGWDIFSDGLSNSNISINTWKHMVFVKNGTDYYLYINGALDKTYTNSTVAVSYYSQMVIGSTDTTATNETFIGTMDDYGTWNRALSQSEITGLYNSSTVGIKENAKENDLVALPKSFSRYCEPEI